MTINGWLQLIIYVVVLIALAKPLGTFRRFSEQFHTTTTELGQLARQARPKLLILYHYNSLTPEELQSEMAKHYDGAFVIGKDLDVY